MDPPPTLKVAFKHALKLERQLKPHLKETKGVESVALASTGAPHTSYPNRDFKPSQGSSSSGSGKNEDKPALFCSFDVRNKMEGVDDQVWADRRS
ncbi:hypothetical protein LINPERPRIM_LOCUS34311 [Linum perenne]